MFKVENLWEGHGQFSATKWNKNVPSFQKWRANKWSSLPNIYRRLQNRPKFQTEGYRERFQGEGGKIRNPPWTCLDLIVEFIFTYNEFSISTCTIFSTGKWKACFSWNFTRLFLGRIIVERRPSTHLPHWRGARSIHSTADSFINAAVSIHILFSFWIFIISYQLTHHILSTCHLRRCQRTLNLFVPQFVFLEREKNE